VIESCEFCFGATRRYAGRRQCDRSVQKRPKAAIRRSQLLNRIDPGSKERKLEHLFLQQVLGLVLVLSPHTRSSPQREAPQFADREGC